MPELTITLSEDMMAAVTEAVEAQNAAAETDQRRAASGVTIIGSLLQPTTPAAFVERYVQDALRGLVQNATERRHKRLASAFDGLSPEDRERIARDLKL